MMFFNWNCMNLREEGYGINKEPAKSKNPKVN